jgi:cellulose synthase/poly-beta-1,6-N-acetylglucosamine synthase-like glycosyltransferase
MYPLPRKPKISVIIPALDEEKFIARTLSVVREVLPDAELIVVDGGSKDNTVQLAKKYAKVCSSRGTIALARNTGAKASVGDILIFLDADTEITPQFVTEVLKRFEDPRTVGMGGKIMPRRRDFLTEIFFYFLNFLIILSFVFRRPALAGTCVAYKRKPFFEVGSFNESMAASEDFDLCRKISEKGKVIFCRKVTIRTSRRRLEKLGLLGLISDWARVTVRYLLGKRMEEYRIFR